MFGSFSITINDKTIDLDHILGKQLVSLFAYIVYNHGKTLSKDRLIAIFWPESESPENAMKNAIFRLRNELKTNQYLSKISFIVTTNNGYSLSSNQEFCFDTDVFDKAHNIIQANTFDNDQEYEKLFETYTEPFLQNNLSDWVLSIRNHYNDTYLKDILAWLEMLVAQEQYPKVLTICDKALLIDPFNDEFHYNYLKALIEMKRYNDAIKYYERISKMFYQELGMPLLNKIQSLLNIISTKDDNNRTNLDELIGKVEEPQKQNGAYYCNYAVFKGLYQLEKRACLRDSVTKYIILVEVNSIDKDYTLLYTNRLIETVKQIARKNDVYSQISKTQVALLLSMKKMQDGYIIIDRLLKEFYRKVPSNKVRVNYYLTDILKNNESEHLVNLRQ